LRFDPALVHAIDVAGAECQRAVAGLAARSACTVAGIAELDWVAPALKDLEQARPLSAPFDDDEKAWELVRTDRRVPWRTAREAVPPSQRPSSDPTVIFQPHLALGVVFAAAQDDPLRAALRAVSSGISTFGEGYRDLLDEVWAALPERDRSQPQPGASG
jgi:hypothetical protein